MTWGMGFFSRYSLLQNDRQDPSPVHRRIGWASMPTIQINPPVGGSVGIIKTRSLQRPGLGIAGMTTIPPSSCACPFTRLRRASGGPMVGGALATKDPLRNQVLSSSCLPAYGGRGASRLWRGQNDEGMGFFTRLWRVQNDVEQKKANPALRLQPCSLGDSSCTKFRGGVLPPCTSRCLHFPLQPAAPPLL